MERVGTSDIDGDSARVAARGRETSASISRHFFVQLGVIQMLFIIRKFINGEFVVAP